jgi:hypothetical protein
MPTTSGVPRPNIRAGARRPQPISTRFELVPHQGGVTRRFLAYSSPSRSPNPNHLAVLARPGFVRAAPAHPGTTRIRLPSAPPSCCDRISDVGLSPPFESLRFTAHARPPAHLRLTGAPGWRRSAAAAEDDGPRLDHGHRAHLHRSVRRRTRQHRLGTGRPRRRPRRPYVRPLPDGRRIWPDIGRMTMATTGRMIPKNKL